jgi:hypothetical protein
MFPLIRESPRKKNSLAALLELLLSGAQGRGPGQLESQTQECEFLGSEFIPFGGVRNRECAAGLPLNPSDWSSGVPISTARAEIQSGTATSSTAGVGKG